MRARSVYTPPRAYRSTLGGGYRVRSGTCENVTWQDLRLPGSSQKAGLHSRAMISTDPPFLIPGRTPPKRVRGKGQVIKLGPICGVAGRNVPSAERGGHTHLSGSLPRKRVAYATAEGRDMGSRTRCHRRGLLACTPSTVRHLVAPSPGVRQCVSSSCNSHTPGFHTSLLHPFSGRMYLYAAKTPASLRRPVGLCLLSISAEELLVSVAGSRSHHKDGSALRLLVSWATSLDIAPTSCVIAAARRSQCRTPPLQRLRRATTLPSRFVGSERHSIPRTRRKSRSTREPYEAMVGAPPLVRSRRCLSST
jgi:hypothetical protein